MSSTRAATAIALLIGIGVLAYLGAVLWVGSAAVWSAALRLGLPAFVAGTAVSSLAYLLRFARWRMLLGALGHRLPWGRDLRVYLAGLAMTSTPGKLGETVRSLFLLRDGVAVPHSLACFFADRLSDVIAVALVGALAALVLGERVPLLEVIALAALAASWLLRRLPWDAGADRLGHLGRHRRLGAWLAAIAAPARAWVGLWTFPRVLVCVLLAMLAYGLQGLVFAGYVRAVGFALPWSLGVTIFCSAILLGAASLVPAGLGVMEAALVAQLLSAGVALDLALAAALLARASTLWFGLLIGAASMLSLGPLADPGPAAQSS